MAMNSVSVSKETWRYVVSRVCAVCALLCLVGFAVLLVTMDDWQSGLSETMWSVAVFLPIVLFLVFCAFSAYLFRTWKQKQGPTVEEALANDPRRPVLYLRPFQSDSLRYSDVDSRLRGSVFSIFGGLSSLFLFAIGFTRRKTGEELMVDMMRNMGPVIAIGRPGEKIPPVGAARVYVGDADWKEVVRTYLRRCQFVLMFAGTTPGFAWELGEICRSTPFRPTLILLPFALSRHKKEQVDRFAEIFVEASGRGIEPFTNLSKVKAIYLNHEQETIYFPTSGTKEEKQLDYVNPFVYPMSLVMEREGQSWTGGYVAEVKKKGSRGRMLILLIVVPLFLLRLFLWMRACPN
jgi:hypothetical protein